MPIKVAIIGAGSVVFSRQLFRDILTVPELQDTHFALHDIHAGNLDMGLQLARKDLKNNSLPATVTGTRDRRKALADADYVINCARIGGIESLEHDIEIPLRYGVDQCIGDTLSAGGIMYGQRNIPVILQFCKDIREVAKPDALFINYANPMCMNTWAALEYGQVRTIGLCHGIEHGWGQIAEVLGGKYPEDVNGDCIGINHQTWYTRILFKGKPVAAEKLLAAFEKHPVYRKTEKCRIDVLRRFGYYSTESNGHLSEYLPWYRKRPHEIRKWIDTKDWASGATGAYLRLSIEGRNWFETDFPRWLAADDPPISPAYRTGERGSRIIEALETGRAIRTYANVQNDGTIGNLPDDAIVEVPIYVDQLGIHVPTAGNLPLACAATCMASINVQRMAKEAAVHGDVMLLKQAMLHDPLVGAACNPPEVWQMTDALLAAEAKWLPQYKKAIPAAKRRLAAEKNLGTHSTKGCGRRKPKTIEELRRSGEYDWLASANSKTVD